MSFFRFIIASICFLPWFSIVFVCFLKAFFKRKLGNLAFSIILFWSEGNISSCLRHLCLSNLPDGKAEIFLCYYDIVVFYL